MEGLQKARRSTWSASKDTQMCIQVHHFYTYSIHVCASQVYTSLNILDHGPAGARFLGGC